LAFEHFFTIGFVEFLELGECEMKCPILAIFIFWCILFVNNIVLFSYDLCDYVNLYLPGADKSACNIPKIDDYISVFSESIQSSEATLSQDNLWKTKRTARGCDFSFQEFQASDGIGAYHCPFIQKQKMPLSYKVCFVGDLHGCVDVLAKIFKRMVDGDELGNGKILNPDYSVIDLTTLIIFLGDYTDRGPSSLDTLFLLSLFKIKNKENVFLLRGNHECLTVNSFDCRGLKSEIEQRFGKTDSEIKLFTKILRIYEYMPISLFLIYGNSCIQCCHGGIDAEFYPCEFLANNTAVFDSLSEFDQSLWVGLLWNDFCSGDFAGIPIINFDRGLGYIYDVSATRACLESLNQSLTALSALFNLKLIIRGHQHSFFPLKMLTHDMCDLDSGLKYWKDVVGDKTSFKIADYVPVLTLSSSTVCQLSCQYSFCVLDVAGEYENWTLTPVEG